jgi:AcrR family transcriptional regulator
MANAAIPRRTQVERSEATKAALLDAAVGCLIERGYQATTTAAVCERAGVSRGAHLHHFHTRAQLVSAALVEVAERRTEGFREEAARLPRGPRRVDDALDLLWSWFTGPLFQVSVDLAAAARTDEELRRGLAPVERALGAETLRRCREMFGRDEADGQLDPLIQMTLGTVRGLALLPVLQPGYRGVDKQWAYARAQLSGHFRASS